MHARFVILTVVVMASNLQAQRLRGVDSTLLEETSGRFISRAAGLAVSRDGSVFVADNGSKHVLSFSRAGKFIRQVGKKGSGPGELESALQLTLDGDSLLVVNNMARLRVEVFETRTGKYRWGVALPRRPFSITSDGGVVRGASLEMGKKSSLMEVTLRPLRSSLIGPVPELINRFPILGGPFGTVVHDERGETIAQSFEVSDYLYVWKRSTEKVDSILIPRVRRRGARRDLLEAAGRDTSRGRDALYKSSVPVAIGWLSETLIAVVHSDVEYRGQLFEGDFLVSVVNTQTRQSCADLPLNVPRDPFPRFAFQAGSLYAFVQHVPDDGEVQSYVVRFALPGSCRFK